MDEVTLSCDHRAVDGAVGSAFLRLSKILEIGDDAGLTSLVDVLYLKKSPGTLTFSFHSI
jgi:hypothetical protein